MTVELGSGIFEAAQEMTHEVEPKAVYRRFVEQIETSYLAHHRDLGQGTRANVWTDHMEMLNGDVCFKTLHTPESAILGLRSEFHMIQRFRDAGVRVPKPIAYISGQESRQFPDGLMAMEAIPGGTLNAEFIRRKETSQRYTAEELKFLTDDISAQIKLANDAHLHHRDLHSENLMRDAKGNVVMIDFGEAVWTLGEEDDRSIYTVNKMRGPNVEQTRLRRDIGAVGRILKDIQVHGLMPEVKA